MDFSWWMENVSSSKLTDGPSLTTTGSLITIKYKCAHTCTLYHIIYVPPPLQTHVYITLHGVGFSCTCTSRLCDCFGPHTIVRCRDGSQWTVRLVAINGACVYVCVGGWVDISVHASVCFHMDVCVRLRRSRIRVCLRHFADVELLFCLPFAFQTHEFKPRTHIHTPFSSSCH